MKTKSECRAAATACANRFTLAERRADQITNQTTTTTHDQQNNEQQLALCEFISSLARDVINSLCK
jgi:hypothetical protein